MKQETGKSQWPERRCSVQKEKEGESGDEGEENIEGEKKRREKKKMQGLTPAILARRVILFISRSLLYLAHGAPVGKRAANLRTP